MPPMLSAAQFAAIDPPARAALEVAILATIQPKDDRSKEATAHELVNHIDTYLATILNAVLAHIDLIHTTHIHPGFGSPPL